jgi:copper chaperone CopZ
LHRLARLPSRSYTGSKKGASEKETLMRNIALLGLTLLLLTPPALSAGVEERMPEGQVRTVIPVSGMICRDCCVKVETAVAMIDGVVGVKADYKRGVVTVTHVKDRVDVKQIVETINTKTTFKATAREEKIFRFTDWPMEFVDHPALLTPLKAPEEEVRFAHPSA